MQMNENGVHMYHMKAGLFFKHLCLLLKTRGELGYKYAEELVKMMQSYKRSPRVSPKCTRKPR